MIKYLLEKEFKQLLRNPMLPRDAARISLYYPAGVALGRKLRNQKYESQHSG